MDADKICEVRNKLIQWVEFENRANELYAEVSELIRKEQYFPSSQIDSIIFTAKDNIEDAIYRFVNDEYESIDMSRMGKHNC